MTFSKGSVIDPRRGANSAAIYFLQSTTVMGPAQNSAHDESHSRGSEAPTLLPGQDLYIWRKAVAEWVDLVIVWCSRSAGQRTLGKDGGNGLSGGVSLYIVEIH
jgi:hypothetical protein